MQITISVSNIYPHEYDDKTSVVDDQPYNEHKQSFHTHTRMHDALVQLNDICLTMTQLFLMHTLTMYSRRTETCIFKRTVLALCVDREGADALKDKCQNVKGQVTVSMSASSIPVFNSFERAI